MTFELNDDDVARVAALPAVREAAESGARLIALWPLTEAMRMDNDAKYAENLQVRVTRAFARVITGEDVTVPDAEFVYEGADTIPGRPQSIVDALLAANDAYDTMAGYAESGDASLVDEAAESLGSDWSDAASVAVHETLDAVEAAVDAGAFDAGEYVVPSGDGANEVDGADPADDDFRPSDALVEATARRFAVALTVCDALIGAVSSGADEAAVRAVLPVLLAVNELREQIAVPRICLTDDRIRGLLDVRAKAADPAGASEGTTIDAVADYIAPLAAAEWAKHREDVLWDPAAAKKKAKEEDEKRNKEALAAKFAHIKDDPGKETVEL
ncbi:hypothetical protein JS528_10500 [Bifidobacterium sp. MA2]|uniref:Uncharacterized protein n=1 Tax=Bifidobacterium santillanense TaxID=2809028 RepID=A0ABS5UT64_9BIFI|nr:hypothetical protein [Bifidobacterium santillanense]MBT1173758.1 hypothetical protein [Bifidobacterium santillanense]